ncbi:hypothetical protein [Bacteroides thetaiotaomicron]|uniref:hypothetical protein n=1 Tax=Bacteroides thetaiotaomicron TaxID=818 RepID=UPI00321A18FB
MDAIGLNPIKLDAIGLDPIRMNAIRLGVPGASSGSGRPYIDPELLSHVKMAISTWGKTNDDPDRAVLKDLSGNGNDMRLLNFGFAGNSGYGLYTQYFSSWSIHGNQTGIIKDSTSVKVVGKLTNKYIVYHIQAVASSVFKIKITGLKYSIEYTYNNSGIKKLIISSDGIYDIPASSAVEGSFSTAGFYFDEKYLDSDWTGFTIEIIPDFEGWLCTDGVDDMIVSEKTVDEMIGDSKECTVISIINYISDIVSNHVNVLGKRFIRNMFGRNGINGKYYICGYTSTNIDEIGNITVVNDILGDKKDFVANYPIASGIADYFSVTGYLDGNNVPQRCIKIAYAGGFIANKVLTTDEINQIIAYFNLDRPGQIIKPQLYCNIKKQGITNDNHAEFNDQLIDFVGGHNIQLNNIGWKGESGIIDGALYLDGISDFGKATGLPILKDYTVVADRKILGNNEGGTLSKSYSAGNGAFIFETGSVIYSFGTGTSGSGVQSKRMLSYLSKYIYNGNPVQAGAGIDSDSMWLGTLRDNDTRFAKLALRSLMLFPYSLSEFLLERQLRKYKAGTLYPGMVEFRPIVKSNVPYSSISYSVNPGMYVTEGSTVTITITLSNETDKLVGVSSNSISDISISGGDGIYEITGKVTKSPQKISIVISSYLTTLGNETLISNETLIKNE